MDLKDSEYTVVIFSSDSEYNKSYKEFITTSNNLTEELEIIETDAYPEFQRTMKEIDADGVIMSRKIEGQDIGYDIVENQLRAQHPEVPVAIYSGYPPSDNPTDADISKKTDMLDVYAQKKGNPRETLQKTIKHLLAKSEYNHGIERIQDMLEEDERSSKPALPEINQELLEPEVAELSHVVVNKYPTTKPRPQIKLDNSPNPKELPTLKA
jgi:hypothetical protein